MELHFFCPRWGSEKIEWAIFLNKVKDAGYMGIEWGVSSANSNKELDAVWNLLERYGLSVIPQHWDTIEPDFIKHYDAYASWFERISRYKIYKINSQTGKDYFSFEQNTALINLANTYAESGNVKVVHETHRNKFLFAAHIANRYFKQRPDLRITLDISHWVTVAESYLSDQTDALETAFERTDHLHARVGHTQSPQVPDPRISPWKEAADIFFNWWQKLLELKKHEPSLSVTTEFGPYPYMPLLLTGKPANDQWELNTYMMDELKKMHRSIF